MKNLSKINSCQICSKPLKKPDLGHHPLCDDLLKINTKRKKRVSYYYNHCNFCHTAFQKFQVRKKFCFQKVIIIEQGLLMMLLEDKKI